MNQIALIETMNPVEIFSPGNLDTILEKIAEEARAQATDISTEKGRKEVASLAYKIARSKTFLDDLGKKLGEEAQAKINAINAERKKTREYLDSLKDEVRRPLTEWENLEKERVAQHENEISKIIEIGKLAATSWQSLKQDFVLEKIGEIGSIERDWQEFSARAKAEIDSTLVALNDASTKLRKQEEERAELERLRAAEALRAQKEREEKIALEAAESARLQAEARAKAEAERAAKEAEALRQSALREARLAEEKAQAAVREKELAEKRAKEAAIKAEQEKVRAVENERLRAEAEKRAAEEAEKKREANRKHSAKINNDVLAALLSIGLDEKSGKALIVAIVSGKIPHTKIMY